MTTELTDALQHYGMAPTSARGALLSDQMNSVSAPPRAPGAPPEDPAVGGGPIDKLGQALQYAKQLSQQVRAPVHRVAQAISQAPGLVGAAGTAVAQATAPGVGITPSFLQGLIRQHESRNNYSAVNPNSTASGAYQYTNGTWGGYGGYGTAAMAPRAVQDRRALQDITANLARYGGDPFKAIAAHYLPAAAQNPSEWMKPYRLQSGKTVAPVADYVRATVANTPLQGKFDAYIQRYSAG